MDDDKLVGAVRSLEAAILLVGALIFVALCGQCAKLDDIENQLKRKDVVYCPEDSICPPRK